MSVEALKAAFHGEVTNAMNRFREELGFTPPELVSMRVDELDARLHLIVDLTTDTFLDRP